MKGVKGVKVFNSTAGASPPRSRSRPRTMDFGNREEMVFWGLIVPPKGKVVYESESGEDVLTYVHLTGMALGRDPAPGGCTVTVQVSRDLAPP